MREIFHQLLYSYQLLNMDKDGCEHNHHADNSIFHETPLLSRALPLGACSAIFP
jgi:hypothetical protein